MGVQISAQPLDDVDKDKDKVDEVDKMVKDMLDKDQVDNLDVDNN